MTNLSGTKITGAQAIMESLLNEGVNTVFGYPGGAIMPAYDALYDYRERIKHVLVRHEQGASHAAEGYARMTGKPGVCIATSGPGATNLVTGIADAMLDSIPMVCVTGQVPKSLLGTDAFQETDVMGITIPITKWSYQVTSAEEIPYIFSKAFYIASNGRPGPVVIDITKNAQTESAVYTPKKYIPKNIERFIKKEILPDKDLIQQAAALLEGAEQPIIFAGHGVLISKAEEILTLFAEKSGIPVALTLHGLSAFPTKHPLYAGMLGMHGNYGPNVLTNKADVILAIGMRFDDRVTGDLKRYAVNAKIIHIDIDKAEIGKNVTAAIGIHGDALTVLSELVKYVTHQKREKWHAEFEKCLELEYTKIIKNAVHPQTGPLKMSEAIHALSEITHGEAVVVADVGQHQMMAARYYKFNRSDSWITSGGLGTMGFALPAAIGAKMASPDREVLAIIGDGGFQMTFQELGTIAQEDLPVKIVILNNQFLGMVRQWQELFFETRYSFVELKNPDFIKLSESFGIPAARISDRDMLYDEVNKMILHKGPYLLEIVVETEQNVFPIVPSGSSVSDIRLE
jgi:acetolactate synthase I/II/III large subunit